MLLILLRKKASGALKALSIRYSRSAADLRIQLRYLLRVTPALSSANSIAVARRQ